MPKLVQKISFFCNAFAMTAYKEQKKVVSQSERVRKMDRKNQAVKERMLDEELEKVAGGIAGIDDFCVWLSKQAGKYIKKLFD